MALWAKPNKYRNVKTVYNGREYHSKKEATRAYELDLLKRAGEITGWSPQPRFRFELHGVKICDYVGDFKVFYKDGREVIEDVKGVLTDVYKIKKKLMKAFYNIDILEI